MSRLTWAQRCANSPESAGTVTCAKRYGNARTQVQVQVRRDVCPRGSDAAACASCRKVREDTLNSLMSRTYRRDKDSARTISVEGATGSHTSRGARRG
jgi:hypothetical protein